jgi:enoyl-CoA hydratase/carnithine racemase
LHFELPRAFTALSDDQDIRVVILTGTGDVYCTSIDSEAFLAERLEWQSFWWVGRRLYQRLLDIDVPVIGVLNGPATIHTELIFLSDVILAADTASVSERHFGNNTPPGDGVHIVWPHVLGPQRGKYFLLTGETLSAEDLLRLGAVNEVLPASDVLPRARELARSFAKNSLTTARYTRALLADPLRRRVQESLSHGLALEGAYMTLGDLVQVVGDQEERHNTGDLPNRDLISPGSLRDAAGSDPVQRSTTINTGKLQT